MVSPILVVGCGFLGERFAAGLLARGVDTVVLTRSDPGNIKREALAGAELIIAEVESPQLRKALLGVGHVIYTAGGLMPGAAEQAPKVDEALNLAPLTYLLQALAEHPTVGLTLLSSGGTVYGRPRYLPIAEEHPTNPISAYGKNKLAAEQLARLECQRHNIPLRILRCSNVYGERQPTNRGQGAIATFVDCLVHDKEAVLYGNGETVRDYVHVEDIVRAGLDLIEQQAEPIVLNVGSGIGHSLNDVLDLITELSGSILTVRQFPARTFDVPTIILDIAVLRTLIRFEPLPLRTGLRSILRATGVGALPEAAYDTQRHRL